MQKTELTRVKIQHNRVKINYNGFFLLKVSLANRISQQV